MIRSNQGSRWGKGLVLALAGVLVTAPVGQTAPKKAADRVEGKTTNLSARIDQAIDARLTAEKVPASPRASDAEFLRRVSLDIAGVIPSAEKVRAFLDSTDSQKREKLVDELLASPDYGKRMADVWQELLLTRTSDNRRMNPAPFVKWLTDSFNANKPWNQMTRELLTATGPQDKNPAVTFYVANESVDKMTDNVTKNLLGLQLQCAQCHNHPFTGWKQNEYWGMAAFFMKVRADNANRAARTGEAPGVTEGPQINRNRRTLPESAKMVPAKFLQGEEAKLKEREPYRPALADWMTAPKNPFFAKAMANRVWSMMFGRGLVNPVDDMHEGNAPTHPELLRDLADGFIASGYDVKALVRAIVLSNTYQRTSKPIEGNADADVILYARMPIKVLSPEMLFDSLTQVAGPVQTRAQQARPGRGPAQSARQQFVNFFQADEGADSTEYNHGIPQVLRLMNSAQINRLALADRLGRANQKPEEALEQVYLAVLSRRPTSAEVTRLLAHLKKTDSRQGFADILWALLNSSEFALNR